VQKQGLEAVDIYIHMYTYVYVNNMCTYAYIYVHIATVFGPLTLGPQDRQGKHVYLNVCMHVCI